MTLVCGINALIDLFNLPVKKFSSVNRGEIAEKLYELSPWNSSKYNSLYSQSIKFQSILDMKIANDADLEERFYDLVEQKLKHFLHTLEYA